MNKLVDKTNRFGSVRKKGTEKTMQEKAPSKKTNSKKTDSNKTGPTPLRALKVAGPQKSNSQKLPRFRSEAQERKFWESKTNDATQYFDSAKMVSAQFKNLKPSTTSISLRMSDSLLDGIRRQANKLDVPYQSLMKVWLTEKLSEAAKS
jgi:predicted DNA binding CopG/RHH family protein